MKIPERDVPSYILVLIVLTAGLAMVLMGGRIVIAAILSGHPVWP